MKEQSKNYNIKPDQIYLRSDGCKQGLLVKDVEKYYDEEEILVVSFTPEGWDKYSKYIDSFKLARVRYYLTDNFPFWFKNE